MSRAAYGAAAGGIGGGGGWKTSLERDSCIECMFVGLSINISDRTHLIIVEDEELS